MKVAVLNTYASLGGAARAARRLNAGLRQAGVELDVFSCQTYSGPGPRDNQKADWLQWFAGCLDLLPCKFYPRRQLHNFSTNWIPRTLPRDVRRRAPDLVHLHWVGDGFLPIEGLARLGAPLVWTLHDSWPFTGGCHLPGDCLRYRAACGYCPVLASAARSDLSRRVWNRKKRAWADLALAVVAPSRWLAGCASSSSLFGSRRIEVIPNGIDTSLYRPGNQGSARDRLGLPREKKLILYGANHALTDRNKGFDLLRLALAGLSPEQKANLELIVVGASSAIALPDIGMVSRNLGVVAKEEELILLYQAADLFVAPSRQENLPNMVMEALACATPCVAFNVGGVPDLISHGKHGYLAEPGDHASLAQGIIWILDDEAHRQELGSRARSSVEARFSLPHVAARYRQLYQELLTRKSHGF